MNEIERHEFMEKESIQEIVTDMYTKYRGKEDVLAKEIIKSNILENHPRKVSHIGMYYYRLGKGGIQRVISMLCPMFLDLGYKITMMVEEIDKENDYFLPENIDVIIIPKERSVISSRDYYPRAEKLQEIICEKGIDTVIYHAATAPLLLYDLLLFRMNDIKFIINKHEFFSQFMVRNNNTFYLQKYTYSLADILLVSGDIERKTWEILGVKAKYIANPFEKYISKSNKISSKQEIVWVGRLEEQKQYMDCVSIMKEVVKEIPDACLKMYGSEFQNGAIAELTNAIENEGLTDKIEYCGYVRGNIAEIYKTATILLSTSISEAFSMVILESKMNGVPLVTYNMPYLQLLRDGKGFIAVENDDVEDAAKAIIRILSNRSLQERLSIEALKSAEEFSDNEIKEIWKQIFLELENGDSCKTELLVENDEMKIILDTIMYHYHKGVTRTKASISELQEKHIIKVLECTLRLSKKPIVIYPYGEKGRYVQHLLRDKFNLEEVLIVDNYLAKRESMVKSIDDLKEMECSDYIFLICSDNIQYYQEIRDNIRRIVSEDNIIDLFS